MIHKIWIRSS